MHRRQAIREDVISLLTGVAAGWSVTDSRVYPVSAESGLPSVDVSTPSETADNLYDQISGRSLTLETAARAEGDDYPATLDQIALEIEQALSADRSLGGLCDDLKLEETSTEATGELETPGGVLTLEWIIRYSADVDDPQ